MVVFGSNICSFPILLLSTPQTLLNLEKPLKSIFIVSWNIFLILKLTIIDIPNQKLIVPKDYQTAFRNFHHYG